MMRLTSDRTRWCLARDDVLWLYRKVVLAMGRVNMNGNIFIFVHKSDGRCGSFGAEGGAGVTLRRRVGEAATEKWRPFPVFG